MRRGGRMIGYCSDWSIKDGLITGRALELAVLVKVRTEIFSTFLSGLSSNGEGLKVINYLIEHQIFFDPSAINTEEVDDKTFTKLEKEDVLDTLNINTDLDVLFISARTLEEEELCKKLAYAIEQCEHKLCLVLDYTENTVAKALFAPLKPIYIEKDMSDEDIIDLLSQSAS